MPDAPPPAIPSSQHHYAGSARVVGGCVGGASEFVMIDGDLIEIPLSSSHRDEDGSNNQQQEEPNRPQQNRLKKGVRRVIGKWIGRGKKKNNASGTREEPDATTNIMQVADASTDTSFPGISQQESNAQDSEEPNLLSVTMIHALREIVPSIPPPVIAQEIGTEPEVSQLQPDPDLLVAEYEPCDDNEMYKIDKGDAPDVESMLRRASNETNTDLDQQETLEGPRPRPKVILDSSFVPLSQAKKTDKLVHNDTLKVLLVGSVGLEKSELAFAVRQSSKKPRTRTTLGLSVHTWLDSDVNFQIWDVQGSTSTGVMDDSPNFGTTPSVQSLFFSRESLYLLVWDLACHNHHTFVDYVSDEEDGDSGNACAKEKAIAEADRALQIDISNRVLAWLDRIAHRAPGSTVIPVAIVPDDMENIEVERRSSKMFDMLENHVRSHEGKNMPNLVLDDSRNVICVNFAENCGIQQIQETMVAIATDSSDTPVFGHINAPVPAGTVEVLEYIRRVKPDHKLIRLDHIMGVLEDFDYQVDQVVRALHFLSSVGEILYFGTVPDEILSSFVILSQQWLVSALSCILRNDLQRELSDARKFMNMQCFYSDQGFQENEVIRALGEGSCPLLSSDDAAMLWLNMWFMREAVDKYSRLSESTATASIIFHFLERLLVHFEIFIPFRNLDEEDVVEGQRQPSEVFFVPCLLSQADQGGIWSYRSTESWTTTLCHSWRFRDGAPSELFEHIAVAVLRDIYLFYREFSQKLPCVPIKDEAARAHTSSLAKPSQHHSMEGHQANPMVGVKIRQIICWKNAMLLKIGAINWDRESEESSESYAEVFVAIVDQNSSHCVASDSMRGNMQRVIVSGKGQSGLNGLKLFRGGYRAVLDSVTSSLESFNNVDMQVVCPDCLSRFSPGRASTWGWDEVAATAEEGRDSTVVCRKGHRVKSGLLCGTFQEDLGTIPLNPAPSKPVSEILTGVVLVGLWNSTSREMVGVGSGFVADKKLGLIVTAGHILFRMKEGSSYGTRYLDIADAKIAIGVIPEKGKRNAVWRYFADILADDVRNNVDACVLRITARMEHDIDDEHPRSSESDIPLASSAMKDENLNKLKVESKYGLEEKVRILGFGQGSRQGINRAPELAQGYICRVFSKAGPEGSSSSSDKESRNTFSPSEEIVVRCPTVIGHSGGPCVNDNGLVVGILSRADPADRHICYLVPAAQLKSLLKSSRETILQTRFAQSF